MSHAPKTHDGSRVLCWDAGTHRGCPNQECRNAHGALGKPHLLDPAVQMEIASRGGLKKGTHKPLSASTPSGMESSA